MKKTRRKILICGMLGAAVIGTVSVAVACREENQTLSYGFNENLTAELNIPYNPQITVGEGTSIASVELYDANGIFLDTAENYVFTPDEIGDYYYRVVFQNNGENTTVNKTVTVRDTVAPTVTQTLTTPVEAELGAYDGFAENLKNIAVSDNNVKALGQIVKKAVAITLGTTVYENPNGISSYLFSEVGEYTVKVAIFDISGNLTYTEYKIKVADSVAPVVSGEVLYYAWANAENKVVIPTVNVSEISTYSLAVSATKNGETVAITDGKVTAQENDVLTLTYTATDENKNVSSFITTLKVLERGQLIDANDGAATAMLTAEGAIEQSGGKITLYNEKNNDTLAWKEASYNFGNTSEYSAIAFTLENYAVSEVKLLLSATQNGERIYVGGTTLAPTDGTAITCLFDITKFGLNEVSSWQIEAQSGSNIYLALTEAKLVPFENDYFTVEGLKINYKAGESLYFDAIRCADDTIREYSFKVNGGESKGAGERYIFATAGTHTVSFTVDVGNKIFTADYTVTVEGTAGTVSLNSSFVTGTVGTEYTIPVATLNGQALQSTVSVNGETVTLQNGKFTPVQAGKYTVEYQLNGETLEEYAFAVEAKGAIDFENATAFEFVNTYGDVQKNCDEAYVTSGLTSAKLQLPANGKVGFVLKTPVALTENANFVTASIYANVAGTAKVQLLVGESLIPYESGALTLSRGNNTIAFPLNENLKNASVYGIVLYNYNKYNNIFFLDNVRLVGEWSLTEVFATPNASYKAEQGGEFIFPKLTVCDSGVLKEVTVSLSGNGLTEPIIFTQNARLSLTAISAGDYTVTYTAKDIFDGTHEISFVLQVGKNALSGSLSLGTYYVGEEIELAQVRLESSVYDKTQLQNATVTKYYRPENGMRWDVVPQTLKFDATGTYQFRYVITVENSKLMLEADTYIHNPDVHIDFEKYAGGDHMYYVGDTSFTTPEELAPSDYWSHDGKYSCKMYGRVGWEWENGVRMGMERLDFDYPIDTVVFYGYSDYDLSPTYMFIGHSGIKSKGNVDIERGEHKYVVFMDVEDKQLSRIQEFGFMIWENDAFYIDDLYFTRAADVQFESVDGNNYTVGNAISFAQPAIVSYDDKIFTEADVTNASYTLEITIKGGKKTTYTFTSGKADVTLPKGEYTVRYIAQIGEKVYDSTQTISVRGFEADFITPDIVYNAGVSYELQITDTLANGTTLEVYYQADGNEEWTALPVSNNMATLLINKSGSYQLKYLAKNNGQQEERIYPIDIRHKDVLFDFELQENGLHHGINDATVFQEYTLSNSWSKNGNYSLYMPDVYNEPGLVGVLLQGDGIQLDGEYKYVGMWIKADKWTLTDLVLTIRQDQNTLISSKPITVPVGEGYYLFEMNDTFHAVTEFGFNLHYAFRKAFSVDIVQAYKEFEIASLPSGVNQNTSLTIEMPKVDGKPCEYATSVKYIQTGEQEYTKVEMKDGKYTFTLTKEGLATVLLEIEINGGVYTYEYYIIVRGIVEDPYVDDMPWVTVPPIA